MNDQRAGRRSAYRAAAICTPGLEFVCAQELTALGCRPRPAGPGTVEFDATQRQLYAANTWLRTASRVVVRVATFRSTDFAHLQQRAAEIDWDRWLGPGVAPTFRVSSNESKLYHTKAIAQRLHDVAGAPASSGGPEQLFIVRFDRNTATVSADSSGTALHRRPWRTEVGAAPLRTTMAAALLLATEWRPDTSLLDPFCGCGTIPIEAALLARRLPPGGSRSFAFERWPDFQPGTMASIGGEVAATGLSSIAATVLASDRDPAAVASARANAERAGVGEDIEFETAVVSHLRARPGPGLIATNPPYGRRVGDGDLDPLYRRLGIVIRDRLPEWSLAMICPDRQLAAAADRRLRPLVRFRHGGLKVELLHRPDPGRAGPVAAGAVSESTRPGSRTRPPG